MRKILKNVKCGIGFCLAVALLLTVLVFAEGTPTSQKWRVTRQDPGASATVTAFGAVAANASVLRKIKKIKVATALCIIPTAVLRLKTDSGL